jgi:hypothetical protein
MNRQMRKIINEELQILREEKIYIEFLTEQVELMEAQGMSKEQINEGFMDILQGLLGSLGTSGGESITDTLKVMAAKYIGSLIGIPEEYFDANKSWIACAITNVIENIKFAELTKYFGDNRCNELADLIMQAMQECLFEKGAIENIMAAITGVPNPEEGSILGSLSKETASNMLKNTEFAQGLRKQLADAICKIEMKDILDFAGQGVGKLLGSFTKSDAADAVKTAT